MGFFKKRRKGDEPEDFILDFESSPDEQIGITPWNERKHVTAAHAMTVNEILFGTNEQPSETAVFENAEEESINKDTEKQNSNADRNTEIDFEKKTKSKSGEKAAENDNIALKKAADKEKTSALFNVDSKNETAEEKAFETVKAPDADKPGFIDINTATVEPASPKFAKKVADDSDYIAALAGSFTDGGEKEQLFKKSENVAPGTKFAPPRDEKPQFTQTSDAAVTETIAESAEKAKEESLSKAAQEMMRSLREKLIDSNPDFDETDRRDFNADLNISDGIFKNDSDDIFENIESKATDPFTAAAAETTVADTLQNGANNESAQSETATKNQAVTDSQKEPTATKPQDSTSVISEKKEIKLSPAAQALYDRMMAQRAHETLKAEVDAAKSSDKNAEIISENAMTEKKTQSENAEQIQTEKATERIDKAEETESDIKFLRNKSKVPDNAADSSAHKNPQNLADSIFDDLASKLENDSKPRFAKSGYHGSLLDKCRSFVTEQSDDASIDEIIHDAEQGARKRLQNVYNLDENNGAAKVSDSAANGYDFSLFTKDKNALSQNEPKTETAKAEDITADESSLAQNTTSIANDSALDGQTREIVLPKTPANTDVPATKDGVPVRHAPVIPVSKSNVKNLQFSLASQENGENTDLAATREISKADGNVKTGSAISAVGGHVTDPVKAQTMRMHLEKIAEQDPADETEQPQLHFTGVDEDELPDSDIKAENREQFIDDYRGIEDADSVRTDLAAGKVSLLARLFSTAAITAILAVIGFGFKDVLCDASPTAYILLNTVLLFAALIINFNTLKGFVSLLIGAPDLDTPAALAAVSSALYTAVTAFGNAFQTLPTLSSLGALALTFNLLGKLVIMNRVKRSFEVIANDEHKKAVTFVEDKVNASIMSGGSVIGEAFIACGRDCKNITGYLHNAYSEDAYEKKIAPLTVFILIAAALLALLGFVFGGGLYSSLVAFCAVFCAAAPVSMILCCSMPFSLVSKKLAAYDAMIAGWNGVETVSNTNAVAFQASELFPAGNVKLYNMQVLNRGALDKYIASAAAVLNAAKSPLAPIFNEILETDSEKCPTADSVKYENGMGVSGWIGDKRVFIGNRTLMEGHSIRTPSLELDKKILRQGYFPVYLAVDQQLCALFIVGYEADPEITYELRRLCSTGVTMLVRSNDPNISEDMICDYFGLYPDSVKLLSPAGVSAYYSATSYKESIAAKASYSGDICGFLSLVTSAIKLKGICSALLILQIVLLCLGVGVLAYFAFTASLLKLPVLLFGGFQLLSAAITAIAASIKQS